MARSNLLEAATELGHRLEDERVSRGLSKAYWVVELETSIPTYNNWISRVVDIEQQNIIKICEVLGVDEWQVREWNRVNTRFRELVGLATQPAPRVLAAA